MKTYIRSLLLFIIFSTQFCAYSSRAETVLWSENFDDGNADSRWYADNGVWQIGSPTVGPQTNSAGYRTHSGQYCVTTGLNGNYLSSQDSRFIRIASFVVPATNQFPRLRFWQWYSFAGGYNAGCYGCTTDEGSYGYVEIKVGTGSWQQVSPTYNNNGSAVWSRAAIDLAPYAGKNVQVAFHFHSAHNTDVGWYVDDVAVVTGTPVFNNSEGFELGLGDWAAERGTWEVGVPTSGPGSAHGGTNCAATVLAGNYASYVDSRFISPSFVVPASNSYPRLRFWQWYSFAGGYNAGCYGCTTDEGSYGYVEIKTGTNAWQTISPTYGSATCGIWWQPSIDLTAYAGQTVQIAFHFHSAHNISSGWYMDDIAVVTGPPLLFNNPVGFESGVGDWYADNGIWQVGVPVGGPGSAHGGTNCVATMLNGGYCSYSDSRFISPSFVVPPFSSALRFWHWYSFAGGYNAGCYGCTTDEGSYGYLEIKAGTNNWQALSPHYTGLSGAWTQTYFPLSSYAGQTVQIALHFHSAHNVSSGWYFDDMRLVNDFGLLLLDSPIVCTQSTACVSIGIADSSPASNVTFVVQAPCGNITNVTLNTVGCWSGTITPQPNCQWLVTLHNSCPTTAMGVQTVGSICYTAVSTQSAFVPFTVSNLGVTNLDSSVPVPAYCFGTRSVIIADQSLLEAWIATNKQRMFTLYGKADTNYVVKYTTNLTSPSQWTPGWTNTMQAGLFYSQPLTGALSNAPVLFLRANEK